MTVPKEIQDIFVRRADESLRKHRPDPVGMCDWCAAVWLRQVRYPCFAARLAFAVRSTYGAAEVDPARSQADFRPSRRVKGCQ